MDRIEGLAITPRLRRSLEEALRVARERGHHFLGTEHVLHGLLSEPNGIAAKVLEQQGVAESTRAKVLEIMDSDRYLAPPLGPHVDTTLRRELLRRRQMDQAPRLKLRPGKAVDPIALKEMHDAQRENAEWLRLLIAERGWPGSSIAGPDGADAAWLIAQHADHDPDFQRMCLGLLQEAVVKGEAPKRNLAYLTDRVMLAEKGIQRYGTQFQHLAGRPEPFPLEDPDHVDELRAVAGLEPLSEYRKLFDRDS